MHKYEILESERLKAGVKYDALEGGTRISLKLADVRGGLAWATNKSSFYYCIVAQEWIDKRYYNADPNFYLLVEREIKGLDIDERFNLVVDDACLYLCDFFADRSPIHEAELNTFYDFWSKHNYRYGNLLPAPYVDNFRLGVEIIKSWVSARRLIIPENTLILDQLSRITENDLSDPDVMKRFFAVDGLRHVVASFKRDPASQSRPDMNFNTGISHPQAWMAH